jgi:hypothetical protein
MTDLTLKKIELRLKRLEDAVFHRNRASNRSSGKSDDFGGPSGGLRYLFAKGFVSEKRYFANVRKALEKDGYHYSAQAAQMALTRLSKSGGPLVTLRQNGKKVYVARK